MTKYEDDKNELFKGQYIFYLTSLSKEEIVFYEKLNKKR